ncbi:hypothetical protein PDESU_02465 [Pontiella desulfatans]|uniref:Uncharacterized protein n=1 Tax=Pontiella desulfatans TaxID=2750659 RepID=A0A6C2U1R3_PONDE|nr:hypothetical protein [Pontiella desulfatans]VGO13908.1 hypothetical protein PDESU_02465 [Pontiella desulfatans]
MIEKTHTLNEFLSELEQLMKTHPVISGVSAVGIGVGCIAVAPVLISIATGLAWIGTLITSCSFLLAGYEERRSDAEKGIALGLLILCGALLLVIAAYLLGTLGIAGVAGGVGIAGKATVEVILRKRIESQLKEKSASELIALTRRLT